MQRQHSPGTAPSTPWGSQTCSRPSSSGRLLVSPLLLMGISMVAALLRIPSDILRACRDTDVMLGPGLPPGQGTSQYLRSHG